MVDQNATTYGTYELYLENYRQPITSWRALEPVTTCDGAIIDLMLTYLYMDPENEKMQMALYNVETFDFESTHAED